MNDKGVFAYRVEEWSTVKCRIQRFLIRENGWQPHPHPQPCEEGCLQIQYFGYDIKRQSNFGAEYLLQFI
jgi:hypothetical protein